MRHVYSYS